MSDLTRRKIRAYAGVKFDKQLPALLDGNLNIAQSLGELGQRYNNEILKDREEKHRKAQATYLEKKKAIVNIDLVFECKKIVVDKSSREPRVQIFNMNENIQFKSSNKVPYFNTQIQTANDQIRPAYNSFNVSNQVFEVSLRVFKELKDTIEKILQKSEVGACIIKSHNITILPKGTPQNILLNPIREAGAMNLDGLILNEVWCKNEGTCVPDWLTYKYRQTKGHIKSVKDYETIERLSTSCENDHPNTTGYTITHIQLFCKNTDKTLIVLHNGKIIVYNQVAKCDYPLVIEIKNNHLYPIIDNRKIKSLVQINSSTFHTHKTVEKPTYDEIEYIKQEGNACDFILDTMLKLNLQTYDQKIIISNGHLQNFHLNKILYSTNSYSEDVKKYCQNHNIEYQGQNPLSFLPPFIEKLPHSFMNDEIKDALYRNGVKHRTHYGKYNEMDQKVHSCDINKCYRFIMENPVDNFMTVDFNSKIETLPGLTGITLEFGLYFVNTADMSILHGSNWYSNNILKMALDNGVRFECKYFIKGKRQDKTILKKIIDEIKDTFDTDITKTLINSISGCLGKTESHSYKLEIDNDINRVWESVPKNVNDFYFKEKNGLYLFGKKSSKELLKNNLPMYIQILDWSNMLMSKYILELGGFENLAFRKTDAFVMNDIGIQTNFTTEIGGYKPNPLPVFLKESNPRNVEYSYTPKDWTYIDVKNSDDIDKINDHLKSKSLRIQGRAGVGKSYVIDQIDKQNKCVKLAYTNKASINIKGETIHKFLGIDDTNKCSIEFVMKKLKNIDILIIDEISMIDGILWKILYEIKLMTGIKFLLCGDFRQLPPVDDETDYFNHSAIMYMCDSCMCELQWFEKCRYDKALYTFLDDLWNECLFTPLVVSKVKKGSHICFTNKRRKEINALYNKGELIKYTGEENKYNEDIRVSIGVPLLSLTTNKKLEIVKNELVEITKIEENKIYFGEKFIMKEDIHKYFMLGYALTIHRAQGQTIDGVLNIHEIGEIVKNKRMLYTAISRATSLENINYVK